MASKTLLTADELEKMPDDDSVQIELDEGELITMRPAGAEHGDSETDIIVIIGSYVRKHRLGRLYPGDTGFRLSPDIVRVPDVALVRQNRLPLVRRKGFIDGPPDLAVEIFSPSDSVRQLMRKVKQYFAAGCHTVWIVYPEAKEVQILEAARTDRLHTGDEMIEAPELLPGFSARISEFFE